MKNAKYWLGLAFMGWASHAFAQSEIDALRYSQLQFGGGARTLGIGGANVALGADIGNLSSNPAGLGLFQRSEVSFTPGFGVGNTSSALQGSGSLTDSRNSLHIGNVGLIFTNRRPDSDNTSDWRAGSFGIGVTRINDFNQNSVYSGTIGDQQSLFQRLRESRISNQEIDDQFVDNAYVDLDGLAYGAYLTNLENNDGVSTVNRTGPIVQRETTQTTGSQSQYDFAYGASYRDKLYIGGAIGVVSTRYDMTRNFYETTSDVNVDLRDFIQTRGTGFNARIGAIYRATDRVRIGASVQTPTWYRLTDTYSTQLSAQFNPPLSELDNNGNVVRTISRGDAQTGSQQFSYNLTTPFRANGGVAVLLGKYGFLTGDIEYVDYSQPRFRDNATANGTVAGYDYSGTNQYISDLYRSTVNLRFGGEARYEAFRFRLGYARYGDPYRANDFDRTQNYYTVGLGLRQQNFFLDVAGVYKSANTYYSPYVLNAGDQPVVSIDSNRFTTSLTIGTTF
ncbi:hypothetical protein MUN82_17565 [Hymenobacter aerilatus]|uniref:Aromatic hydrocarbon degradation protein n=1 Tax=Hymenobacter aerilatus TaxID=2932251 RepID=A0A8T9SUW6_9BACT|nr:hypothetical protein [Hymenobacter aerilatus]UOR04744.1 hypothetical protein MUN82_17565 [Hymenobacter aerilatus]